MRALDTNVLARFFVDDADDAQAAKLRPAAVAALSERSFVSVTVLLELEWVMRGFYELPKRDMRSTRVSISRMHCTWRAVRVFPGSRHSTNDWRSGQRVLRWRHPWSC